jgi:hypothetical protein
MADEAKLGKPWLAAELDEIVADYFAMLSAELSGQSYSKSAHSKALMARIGRTHRSVEFKHQNISAVLDELALPWIRGYIPKRNYQGAIFDAIERYLTGSPGILDKTPSPALSSAPASPIFVPAPEQEAVPNPIPKRLRELVRKFDPVERDYRNRALGSAGEEFVVDLERRRLAEANRPELARGVRWVAREEGDGVGYDVLSSDDDSSQPRLIEVKTTASSARTPFYLSRNECEVALKKPDHWRIYRVHLFASEPRVFTVAPPLVRVLRLRAEVWRASL